MERQTDGETNEQIAKQTDRQIEIDGSMEAIDRFKYSISIVLLFISIPSSISTVYLYIIHMFNIVVSMVFQHTM